MNFSFLEKYWAYFNYGALVTIIISACVVFFGSIIGVLIALAKRSNIKVLDWLVSFYVWIFRGTPMVVQISLAFAWMHFSNMPIIPFGVLDMDLSRLVPGIIVISLNSGAYISESIRAGIESVPKGQLEAAYSLGIKPLNAYRYVVMPQALKISYQLWEMNLSLLSRTPHSCRPSVLWNFGTVPNLLKQLPISRWNQNYSQLFTI